MNRISNITLESFKASQLHWQHCFKSISYYLVYYAHLMSNFIEN